LKEQNTTMEFTKEAYVASLSLKTIIIWRFIRSWLLESEVHQSLKSRT